MALPEEADVKRGDTPTTLCSTGPETVTFLDKQPPDRYNLVFYADYSDRDAVLEATDAAFLQLYHETFPNALESKLAWATKASGSRSHCKADLIKKVGSLLEIAYEMRMFIYSHNDKVKKFGTIILTGHGNPQEFALPITRGSRRLALPQLEIGLRYADSLDDTPPAEWNAGKDLWKQLKSDLLKLQVETDILHKNLTSAWTDGQTLLRLWCCNLGRNPAAGAKDALQILGKIYMGKSTNFMIEAPRNRSASRYDWFSLPSSAGPAVRAKLFKDQKKQGGLWHPDTISEVESDNCHNRHRGADLKSAQAEFVDIALQSPPPPRGESGQQWIPVFCVENAQGRWVFPQNWTEFTGVWRRANV